jgi:hypothetical protein
MVVASLQAKCVNVVASVSVLVAKDVVVWIVGPAIVTVNVRIR